MDIDSKIKELYNLVEKTRKSVEEDEEVVSSKWITNCVFDKINIQTASKDTIKEIVKRIILDMEIDAKANSILGINEDYKIFGYSSVCWFADCKKRLTKIELAKKKEMLDNLEKRLNGVLSPEQKRAMELEEIIKMSEKL